MISGQLSWALALRQGPGLNGRRRLRFGGIVGGAVGVGCSRPNLKAIHDGVPSVGAGRVIRYGSDNVQGDRGCLAGNGTPVDGLNGPRAAIRWRADAVAQR